MSDVIAISAEQGAEACRAVWDALRQAGPAGLTPGEACRVSGLPDRRYRRAVERLVAEGRVRRDGKTRLFAIVDDAGRPVPVDDAAGRRRAAEAAERAAEAYRGQILGHITDGLDALDGRRVPFGRRAEAEGARRYLRTLYRHVQGAADAAELEYLTAEASPVIEQLNTFLREVERDRAELARWQESVTQETARLKEQRRAVMAEFKRLESLGRQVDRFDGDIVSPVVWEKLTTVPFLGHPVITWEMEPEQQYEKGMGFVRALGMMMTIMENAERQRQSGYRNRTARLSSPHGDVTARISVRMPVGPTGRRVFVLPAETAGDFLMPVAHRIRAALDQVDARIESLRSSSPRLSGGVTRLQLT